MAGPANRLQIACEREPNSCDMMVYLQNACCAACATMKPISLLKACAACSTTWYCGLACQRKHWRIHKHLCKASGAAAFKSNLECARAGDADAQYDIFTRLASRPMTSRRWSGFAELQWRV